MGTTPSQQPRKSRRELICHDIFLIAVMATLAGCGLIYEYLMAHYAGRVIGALESTLYAMIGLMIVAMGLGALLAKWFRCPFKAFAWLEWGIASLGATALIIISLSISLAFSFPAYLQDIYGLHPSITTDGQVVQGLAKIAKATPFVIGALLGLMIGMEIPLIARIREQLHGQHLEHNLGTIYGADYIGAGIGAAIWVLFCLQLPVLVAALSTALVNALIGIAFLIKYSVHLPQRKALWLAHVSLLVLLAALAGGGAIWMDNMHRALFKDKVLYTKITPYQHLTLTERIIGAGLPKITSLYINGRLQFSSNDELIYHSYLTVPPLLASARQDKILVIGGGDGLALRDIMRWQPEAVTLIDLDGEMISLFSGDDPEAPPAISARLLQLNGAAFRDKRVEVIVGDAFVEVEALLSAGRHFDTIIVDLPDPSHPDINKVYSTFFYLRLKQLLSADGAIGIQSTSPFHTQQAFISIGKTLQAAGFTSEQYHANVPTFGEWGWTIGTLRGGSASQRIAASKTLNDESLKRLSNWVSKPQILAAFVFSPRYFVDAEHIKINTLGSHQLYQYHQRAWKQHDGAFFPDKNPFD